MGRETIDVGKNAWGVGGHSCSPGYGLKPLKPGGKAMYR